MINSKNPSPHTPELQDFQKQIGSRFLIRRAIIGGQGVGKTPYIKNEVLPSIPNENYFIIDLHGTRDYDEIPENKIYRGQSANGISHTIEQRQMRIEKIIMGCHHSKVFVFEDCSSLIRSKSGMKWFVQLVQENNLQFILVCQGIKLIYDKLDELIDLYYLIGPPIEKLPKKIYSNSKMYYLPRIDPQKRLK